MSINKYISQPTAGLKDGLIRVPLGFSGEVLPDILHVLFQGCFGSSSTAGSPHEGILLVCSTLPLPVLLTYELGQQSCRETDQGRKGRMLWKVCLSRGLVSARCTYAGFYYP